MDVAKASGVSDGTVSRALASDPRISQKTRDKVLKTAEKLNYHPHLFARYLKTRESRQVGVYWQGGAWLFYNQFYGSLLIGFADSAEKDGNHLVFYLPEIHSTGDTNPNRRPIRMTGFNELMDGRVDGAVVLGFRDIPDKELSILRKSGLPIVLMSQQREVPGFFQHLAGTYDRTKIAVEKLLDLGHRRIGYMGLYEESLHDEVVQQTVKESYRRRGLKLEAGWKQNSGQWNIWDVELIERQLKRLFEYRCTGIICVSAEQAILTMQVLKRRGIKIPKDMSMIAYGPFPMVSQFQIPSLCLVEADLIKSGSEAYDLYKEAKQGGKPRSISIEWKWDGTSESIAPPRKNKI